MSRAVLPFSLALLMCAGAAQAADPANVKAAFGNTIVSTYPDGRTSHLWLKADGTYKYEGRRKTPSSGRWTEKGDRVCLKQSRPVSIFFTFCTPVPAARTWTAKAPTGEALKVRLVDGIVH
jgi:hypothetical protein